MADVTEYRSFLGEVVERMAALADEIDGEATEVQAAELEELQRWAEESRTVIEAAVERQASIEAAEKTLARASEHTFERESINVNVRTDPFEDLERVDSLSSADLRARAETVVESHLPAEVPDAYREAALSHVNRRSTKRFDADAVRQHIITSSSPAYVDAFEQYVRSGANDASRILFNRAAMSLTAANGGVLIPQFLDPTIVLTNAGSNNAIRQVSDQVTITVDQWDGVTSAGVTASFDAEGAEVSDDTPTFVAPTISVHQAQAYAFGSYQMIEDSGFDEIGVLFADAFDRLEETQFTTGTGSGAPYGLITRLSGTGPSLAGSSGDAGAADLAAADLYALVEGLNPRWRRNATFMANIAIYNDVRQLGTSDSAHSFWVHLDAARPALLLGRPAVENEAMDSTVVSGSNDDVILFGDFKAGYKIVDRIGTSVIYNPLVIGSNQRPTGQAGWYARKRVGADVITSNAFRLLRL